VRRRRSRTQALVGTVIVVALAGASACGSRLSSDQRALAIQQGGATGTGTGTATGGTTTGGSTTGGTSTGGFTGSTGGSTGGTTGGSATGGTGSCTATSKNNGGATDTGITATTIKVGNISDISGPVPGLFKSAENAYLAFINYFNSTHPTGICGRKLVADPADSATDSGTDRAATESACHNDFAIVGSQSAFDDGGAAPIQSCGLVDIPAAAVTSARQANNSTHAANSTSMHYLSTAVPAFFKGAKFGSALKHAAFLYINAGASIQNAQEDIKAYKQYGVNWVYTAGLPVQSATTQGFASYVQKMKSKGVQFVEWIGAYQEAAYLAQAMANASFKPKAYLLDPTGYNPQYISLAGAAANGTYIYDNAVPLNDTTQPEMRLYAQSLQASGVSDPPTYFGQYAWSAMRLFTELAFKIGPHLTRKAMTAQLAKVSNWTDHGMHAAQSVGSKITGKCNTFLQVQNGRFVALRPSGSYACGSLIHVS
jgi:substrate-binding family protein